MIPKKHKTYQSARAMIIDESTKLHKSMVQQACLRAIYVWQHDETDEGSSVAYHISQRRRNYEIIYY